MASLETEIGVIAGSVGQSAVDLEPGMKAVSIIRPECFKIETFQTEENCFPGKVGEATYFGEVAQYQFLSGVSELKVFELNPRIIWGQREQALFAWADSEDVVILNA